MDRIKTGAYSETRCVDSISFEGLDLDISDETSKTVTARERDVTSALTQYGNTYPVKLKYD